MIVEYSEKLLGNGTPVQVVQCNEKDVEVIAPDGAQTFIAPYNKFRFTKTETVPSSPFKKEESTDTKLRVGQIVTFKKGARGGTEKGTLIKMNPSNAVVQIATGQTYNVPYALLI